MYSERAQAGAFLPKLLEHAGLLTEAKPTKDAGEDVKESAETVGEDAEESAKTVEEDAKKVKEGRVKEIMQRYEKANEAILELNAVLVYKKVVQGLIYSPPDCDKYLALDAKPQVSVASPPPTLASGPTVAPPSGIDTVPKRVSG